MPFSTAIIENDDLGPAYSNRCAAKTPAALADTAENA